MDLGISKHVPLIFTAGPDSGVENLYNVMEGPGPLGVIAEKKKPEQTQGPLKLTD